MGFQKRIFFACIATIALAGCTEWKQTAQTDPQNDAFNTAMLFDSEHGLAVGEFNITRYTKNGGKNWISTMGSKTHMFGLYGCSMLDATTVFATGNSNQALYSTNSGETWHQMSDIDGIGKSISFSSVSSGWVSSRTWLASTIDQGKTWTKLPIPQGTASIEALCAVGNGTGYVVSEGKDVFYTGDFGSHWEKLANPFTALKVQFKPLLCLGTQGIALSMNGKTGTIGCIGTVGAKSVIILSSTADGGKSWQKPEIHSLKKLPKTVTASPTGLITILNKDMSITVFTRKN